jgi:chromosome segregation ATPase
MRSSLLLSSLILGAALVTGCGGSNKEANAPTSTSSAKVELSAMEELKAIPKELDAEAAALTKPIDDVQSVIDQLAALPKKHGINAADMSAMAKATFEKGTVEVKLDAKASAEAKAEVEAALNRLKDTTVALKATPDKVASLTTKIASATAKVPVLATKITSSATVTASNPMASADAKAHAKADLDGVKQAQADVQKSISDTQAKVTGIPALATTALAKLTASFAGGAGGGGKSSAKAAAPKSGTNPRSRP